MDFENISINVDESKVSKISQKCQELQELEKVIALKKIELSEVEDKANNLQERVIPDLMQEAGVSMIKILDGSTVEVKPSIKASITVDNAEKAYSWLREKGFGDLIKNTLTASFNKEEDAKASELMKVFEERGLNYQRKEKVEPMTLKAFVQEQIQAGKEMPMDLFSVYITNKTKITNK
jgi:hypothetical protein